MVRKKCIEQVLEEAIKKAKLSQQPILFSEKEEVEWEDPLLFYELGKTFYRGERFFWRGLDEEIYIGIGFSYQLQQNIEQQWNHLMNNCELYSCDQLEHTPMMFGGYTFDSLKKKTNLWEDFPDNLFVIPTFLLTMHKSGSYITSHL